MGTVDYQKLSEQYAGFLVAVGGVSITVLALVLSFDSKPDAASGVSLRSFLVVALVVATVTCFIGAHMMAETAAFIAFHKNESGARLFLLASANIFIAIILVLFALMLLPKSSGKVDAAGLAKISFWLFLLITFGAAYWMVLAAYHRVPVAGSGWAIWSPLALGSVLGFVVYLLPLSKSCMLWIAFTPSAISTFASLVGFAWIFKEGDKARLLKACIQDIWFFSSVISFSYAPLVVAGIRTMLDVKFTDGTP